MTNKSINNYIPEPLQKPTATIAYFNEVEWNKDLTPEELKQQELINASYQDEWEVQERGYGPCRGNGSSLTSFATGAGIHCSCTKEQLAWQLSQAESELAQLKNQVRTDLDTFWEKFKQYDQEWDRYKSEAEAYINDNKLSGRIKDGMGLAFFWVPGYSVVNEVYWRTISGIIGNDHMNNLRNIYNRHITRKYEETSNLYSEIRRKY